jgi:hypothetical protein
MKREDKDLKLFIFALAIVLSVFSIKLAYLDKKGISGLLLSCACLLFVIGISRPDILNPFYQCWMIVARAIGILLTSAVLVSIFYLVITPIGLFLRLAGKDLLDLKMRNSNSYWHERQERPERESYLRQY